MSQWYYAGDYDVTGAEKCYCFFFFEIDFPFSSFPRRCESKFVRFSKIEIARFVSCLLLFSILGRVG